MTELTTTREGYAQRRLAARCCSGGVDLKDGIRYLLIAVSINIVSLFRLYTLY